MASSSSFLVVLNRACAYLFRVLIKQNVSLVRNTENVLIKNIFQIKLITKGDAKVY